MGTRSLSSIKIGGVYHTQYTQFDGYLGHRGVDFTKMATKLVPYLNYLKGEKKDWQTFALEAAKGFLTLESLESGHGWRGEDEKGHNWSYQEDTKLDVSNLASWIEYVRVLDLDEGTLAFYGATVEPESLILTLTTQDLLALDWCGQDVLYKLFAYLDQQEDRKAPIKLTIKTGRRIPKDTHSWATSKEHERDYCVMSFGSKVIYASMFSPKGMKDKAEKNAKMFEKETEKDFTLVKG